MSAKRHEWGDHCPVAQYCPPARRNRRALRHAAQLAAGTALVVGGTACLIAGCEWALAHLPERLPACPEWVAGSLWAGLGACLLCAVVALVTARRR